MTVEEFRISFSCAVAEDDKPLCEVAADGVCELTNAGLDNLTNIAEVAAEPLFAEIAELKNALKESEGI
jgi:hypothetical protein